MKNALQGGRLRWRGRAALRIRAYGLLDRRAGNLAADAECQQIPHIRRNREHEADMEHRLEIRCDDVVIGNMGLAAFGDVALLAVKTGGGPPDRNRTCI